MANTQRTGKSTDLDTQAEHNVEPGVRQDRTTLSGTHDESQPSLARWFEEFAEDFSTLLRKEVQLARAETMQTINNAMRSIITMAAGGLVAYSGLILFLAGVGIWIGLLLDSVWLGMLAVGAIVLVIGVIVVFSARAALKNLSVTPEKTVQTLQNDAQWAKEKINESR